MHCCGSVSECWPWHSIKHPYQPNISSYQYWSRIHGSKRTMHAQTTRICLTFLQNHKLVFSHRSAIMSPSDFEWKIDDENMRFDQPFVVSTTAFLPSKHMVFRLYNIEMSLTVMVNMADVIWPHSSALLSSFYGISNSIQNKCGPHIFQFYVNWIQNQRSDQLCAPNGHWMPESLKFMRFFVCGKNWEFHHLFLIWWFMLWTHLSSICWQ